jgi:hypothetical protein
MPVLANKKELLFLKERFPEGTRMPAASHIYRKP